MFVLVIAIFGICWLPYHVYFIYSFHDQSIVRYDEHNSLVIMLYMLASLPGLLHLLGFMIRVCIVRYDKHNSPAIILYKLAALSSLLHLLVFTIRALSGTMNINSPAIILHLLPYHV
jgi:hypothetical protein